MSPPKSSNQTDPNQADPSRCADASTAGQAHQPGRVPVIGLTGAPGSGKTLVARCFEQLGAGVIDADALARQAYERPEVLQTLQQWWGSEVFDREGRPDRSALAQKVFENPRDKQRLEALIHPRVAEARRERRRELQADPNVKTIVEDCPLLLEVGLDRCCDTVVFVDAPWEQRLQRVREHRGWSAQELSRREKNQLPLDTKRQKADYLVTNDADPSHCLERVRRVLSDILHRHPTD